MGGAGLAYPPRCCREKVIGMGAIEIVNMQEEVYWNEEATVAWILLKAKVI